MIEYLAWLGLYAIAVERATELVHQSKIFAPLRNWLSWLAYPAAPDDAGNIGPAPPLEPFVWRENPFEQQVGRRVALFLSTMLGCGYCASVWVAAGFALFFPSYNNIYISWWLVKLLILHGLANLYHVGYERARAGRVKTYDVAFTLHPTTAVPAGADVSGEYAGAD